MEIKENTPSVIAKLMGLYELQPQHGSLGPIKVLSDGYLRKIASLAMLEKSLVHPNRLPRKTEGKQHVTKHVFDAKPIQSTVQTQFRNLGRKSAKRLVVKSIEELGNCSGEFGDDLDGVSRAPSELKDEARSLFSFVSDGLHQGNSGDYVELTSCLKPANKTIEYRNKSRDIVSDIRLFDKKDALEDSVKVRISHRVASRASSIIKDTTITPSHGSFSLRKRQKFSNQFLDGSIFPREAKTNIFEQWKASKYSEELAVSGGRCPGQMLSMNDGDTKLEKFSSSESFCSQRNNSDSCTSMVHRSKVSSTNEYIKNLPSPVLKKNSFAADPVPNSSIEASQNKHLWRKETGTGNNLSSNNLHSGAHDILPLELNRGALCKFDKDVLMEADGHGPSGAGDNLIQQKSLYYSFDEELIFTCTDDLGSTKNLREINQPSPDSVLEPAFKEDSGNFSVSGLAMKLHLLNDESSEVMSSDGSVLAVSSDEETEKGSVDLSQDYEIQWGPSRPEESRDFSYLIDVLDEATLFGLNLDTWCETWHETEYPLNPSLFEALEKKYGKQTSWPKSDRRLLFDYINSGMRSIQDSYMDYGLAEKPLRKRLRVSLSKSDIEEELWMHLTLEKEAKKYSSEKAFGIEQNWFELDEDISIICKEIVDYLFDELATEICSTGT